MSDARSDLYCRATRCANCGDLFDFGSTVYHYDDADVCRKCMIARGSHLMSPKATEQEKHRGQ